jgi:hypothetical protein
LIFLQFITIFQSLQAFLEKRLKKTTATVTDSWDLLVKLTPRVSETGAEVVVDRPGTH